MRAKGVAESEQTSHLMFRCSGFENLPGSGVRVWRVGVRVEICIEKQGFAKGLHIERCLLKTLTIKSYSLYKLSITTNWKIDVVNLE